MEHSLSYGLVKVINYILYSKQLYKIRGATLSRVVCHSADAGYIPGVKVKLLTAIPWFKSHSIHYSDDLKTKKRYNLYASCTVL